MGHTLCNKRHINGRELYKITKKKGGGGIIDLRKSPDETIIMINRIYPTSKHGECSAMRLHANFMKQMALRRKSVVR